MKTIIANQYQKNQIMHDAAALHQGRLTDVQVLSLTSVMKEDRDQKTETLLLIKQLLDDHQDAFPIYRDMFKYPAFLDEILSFAKECMLWGITENDLPVDTENEKELQKILASVFTLDLAEKKIHDSRNQIINSLKGMDIELYPAFYSDEYHYEIDQLLRNIFPIHAAVKGSPQKELRYGLNTRQEIEAAAQNICRSGKSCNIVLCDYANQYPVVKQVFARYHIPFSAIKEHSILHIPHIFAALCRLAHEKSRGAFLQALQYDAFNQPCPLYLYNYFVQRMRDATLPERIADTVAAGPFKNEAQSYQKLDDECMDYLDAIREDYNLLMSSSTPQEIFEHAYTVMQRSSYLSDQAELNTGMEIRSTLQSILNSLKEEEVPFLIETIDEMTASSSLYHTDFCEVTDLTHPVSTRDDTYVLGCSGKNYPGFPAKKGLFDEAYVQRTAHYPSLAVRHASYMDQLNWIGESSQGTIYYSYATNDYAGHEIQLALEVESLFAKDSEKKWELDILKQKEPAAHALSNDTAHALFAPDGRITGSISTIERWFSCPYAYFIQSGLNVRGPQLKANDAASIGTIQHAVMENSVNTLHEKYAEITDEEIRRILSPYFDALKMTHPNETERMSATQERMIEGLSTSLHFLLDMEQHTSFVPSETEHHFEEDIVDGVHLRGIIDRIDTCNDLLRIIDYKSSDHKLPENGVKAGLYLQLLSYLIVAQKLIDKKPAGAYYYSLKDVPFSVGAASVSKSVVTETEMNENTYQDNFMKARRMRGWTFEDRKVELDEDNKHIVGLKTMMDYNLTKECIEQLYTYFHDHLLSGEISLSPVEGACTFCDYRAVCRFAGEYRKASPLVMKDISLKQRKEGD